MKRQTGLILLAVVASLMATAAVAVGNRKELVADSREVGNTYPGQTAYEVVGRIDQEGQLFTGYGYLTYIEGVPDGLLFTDPYSRTEATARFTFFATSNLSARSVISTVFVLNSTGTLNIHFDEGAGASFDDPGSFADGDVIATSSARFQDILSVQSPNRGIATGLGELRQLTASPFTLGGYTYSLGRPGLLSRLWYTGEGTRTEPNIPLAFVVLGGHVTVTGQQTYMPLIRRNSGP